MNINEFLLRKNLIGENDKDFIITLENGSEVSLFELMEEYSNNQISDLEGKYLRLMADLDNFKKRSAREKSEISDKTKIDMLSAIIEVDNDLSIAFKSISDESSKEGINLMIGKISLFLKQQGVKEIQTKVYDDDLHEVISLVDVGGESKKIVEVISKGYQMGNTIIKYPKIILSK